jgi:hypothetical protein
VRPDEYAHGRELLRGKVQAAQPRLVIFTFKKTAEVLFGPITGNGHIRDLDFGGRPIFVMPGPYAPGSQVERRLVELGELADRQHSE